MRWMKRAVGFGVAVAVATVLGGWWAVPIVTVAWVRVFPHERHPVALTGCGAALGWGGLLGWAEAHAPLDAIATALAGVLGLPVGGLLACTLGFASLLAAATAAVAAPRPFR